MNRENGSVQVKSLAKSFKNAFKGVLYCIKNERNMRIHLTVTFYVLIFSPFYHFSQSEMMILLLAIGMVLFAEAVNTAIEAIVNLQIQCYDHLARIAKDVAAGAVLICAVFSAAVGIILFFRTAVLINIFNCLVTNWILLLLFVLSLPVSVAFIFGIKPQNPTLNFKK
jgi:diacylglycerol kinase (ATP)